MRGLVVLVLAFLSCSFIGPCSVNAETFSKPKYYKSCAHIYDKYYLPGKLHKAFAVNSPPGTKKLSSSVVCWSTDTAISKDSAVSNALKKCAGEVIRRGAKGKCRIYAAK